MHRNFVAALAALGLFASTTVLAKEEPKQADADKDKNESAEPAPEPASSTTRHEVQIDGQTVKYTATDWLADHEGRQGQADRALRLHGLHA